MALNQTQASSTGIWNAVKGALGIFENINKAEGVNEDSNSQPQEAFESKLPDDKIIELVTSWKRSYNTYYKEIEGSQKISFEYWLGKQNDTESDIVEGSKPLVDNLIFEAVETFIPIATRANPDPLVTADPGEMGQKVAHEIKESLVHEADRIKLRKKLKGMLRHWIIYKIGVLKHSYNPLLDRIDTDVINPKRMIFDKDGYVDEAGNFQGEYLGEKMQNTAEKLIELFPTAQTVIMDKCQGKMGTKIEYISWWYKGRDNFYTMDDTVLGKFINPHWNWDSEAGDIEGKNHFDEPMAPYTFLAIFSTGLQPHDETSLISQNVGLQDMVNRRYRQIDDNVRKMNNGMVVSSDFTDSQASQAAAAMARGGAIRSASKDVTTSVMRLPAPPIPAQVFEMLNDGRAQIKNIFGTSGSSPEAIGREDTARGKILVNQLDSSRIGGGITEYLEQVADTTYNWWVQMMFVHWTDEHYVIAGGATGAADLLSVKNTDFLLLKTLNITVKEGSLVPKDPLTQRNEAIDLWSAGAIDPVNFYKKLDFADPMNAAQQLILWQMVQKGQIPPQAYLPTFQQPPMMGMPGQVPPQPGQGVEPPGRDDPGVGGAPVNPIGGADQSTPPPPGSTGSVEEQGKQLLDSVPIR